MTDKEFAIRESECNSAAERYFEARPFLMSQHSRRVFDAWFERGWKAAQAQQPAQATTAQEPAGYMRSDGMKAIVADEKSAWIESGKGDVVGDYTVPLYTHPAPQRKSLTPMQLADIENRHNWQTTAGRFAIYREIEAAITKGEKP